MFQEKLKNVLRRLKVYFTGASRVFQKKLKGCVKKVLRIFQETFKEVLMVFKERLNSVSEEF